MSEAITLHDREARLLGIPFFALAITHLSGVLGPHGPGSLAYWLGCAWFILLSAVLWHANRHFLVRLRRRYDWREHPLRKIGLLLAANVFTTVPLTVVMHLAWYRFAGLPLDTRQLGVTTLVIVVSVVFVTHAYETAFLIRQGQLDQLAAERLERARVEAELHALKTQVDPHFLFNALTSLAWLIPRDAGRAVRFVETLGEIYAYILKTRERDLVPLHEELQFAEAYVGLLHLRFGEAFRLRREEESDEAAYLIPPVSLQVLLENAVKHNAVKEEDPLEIRVSIREGRIEVSNRRSGGTAAAPSGVGLANLSDRYRRIVGRGLEVRDEPTSFTVVLPLVRSAPRSST